MRDRPIIYAGLLVFLLLAASPVWLGLAARTTARGPELKLPRGKKECVRPTAYMRTSHMDLLILWRDDVVRRGDHAAEKRLTSGCLAACHGPKADFCDRCHNYAAVRPVCWDCHNDAPATLKMSQDRSLTVAAQQRVAYRAATVRERSPEAAR